MAASPSVVLDLLLRARTGDADAAGELLGKYREYLKVLAARHLDSPLAARIDASDLVQQTCLSVVRQLPKFEGNDEAAFVAWLKTIHEHNIQNAIRDHLRAEKRAAGREVGLGEHGGDDGLLAQARASSPSQRAMQGEQAARLRRSAGRPAARPARGGAAALLGRASRARDCPPARSLSAGRCGADQTGADSAAQKRWRNDIFDFRFSFLDLSVHMTQPITAEPSRDDHVDAVLADFFERQDRGEPIALAELIASHPDLEADLREFFDAAAAIEQLAGPTVAEQSRREYWRETTKTPGIAETLVPGQTMAPIAALPHGPLPEKFGRYAIRRLLGEGAMGSVYLCKSAARPIGGAQGA